MDGILTIVSLAASHIHRMIDAFIGQQYAFYLYYKSSAKIVQLHIQAWKNIRIWKI
jgi:hypothetical protein